MHHYGARGSILGLNAFSVILGYQIGHVIEWQGWNAVITYLKACTCSATLQVCRSCALVCNFVVDQVLAMILLTQNFKYST